MIPLLEDYTDDDFARASWPAIERYRHLITRTPQSFQDELRIRRHHSWLRCALATALDRASAKEVCEFWSDEADSLIRESASHAGLKDIAILALGKLGSRELNLSSDVDLILVRPDSDQSLHQTKDETEWKAQLKAVRQFQANLTDYSDFGFALRVDLTLRPGGKSAALIPSFSEFEFHYGYHGEPWERLAYVRLRILPLEIAVATSNNALENEIRQFAQKFSYRKHLDFTLLEELKNLRTKIRQEKFEARIDSFHLKLGPGGIRELELFVHALQIIHGGRQPELRTFSTSLAIAKIKELKLLPAHECDTLLESYWYLRTLENRLHAYEDQQAYVVDLETGHPALPPNFAQKLRETTAKVTQIADSLFGSPVLTTTLSDDLNEQQIWLREKGFSAQSQTSTWPELLEATAISRRSDQDEKERLKFLKGFTDSLASEGVDRDLGLSLLLDFVKATRAKASFFTLLNRQPRVRDDFARLFSISPYLGSILASRPELIDEFIFRKTADPSADLETLLEELAERRLLVELIASNQFLADHDLERLSENLTSTADRICIDLLDRLKTEYHAPDVALIAMGKWGGRELGLRSDLDFIFVTPGEPTPEENKVARRFLARMTEPHRGGSIYAVDMRLRPSGNAGPILISEVGLKNYLATEAAAWERQAYLRARPLSMTGAALGFSPAQIGSERGLSASDSAELTMIRAKLFKISLATDTSDLLDLKLNFGGLADVEFTAQIALLERREFSKDPSTSGMIETLETRDAAWARVGPDLRARYRVLRKFEQVFQLTTSQSGSKLRPKSDEFHRLAKVMKCESTDLEAQIRSQFQAITELLKSLRS